MEIKVKLKTDEVREIIKAHALKEFPVDVDKYDVDVLESYNSFTVEICEKVPEPEKEPEIIEEGGERK